jgi:starvation-inducible DNA-binding protein
MDMGNSNASLDSNVDAKIDIGIPNDSLEMIVRFFNPDIADEYVVLTKTKRYHWNLIDSRFHDLHQFLKV